MKSRKGEKVVFHKEDMVSLDRLPSALSSEAQVLRSPRRRVTGRLFKGLFGLLVILLLVVGGLFTALENGFLDQTLTARAQAALDKALGEGIDASIGSTRLRFSGGNTFALEARNVALTESASGRKILNADNIRLVADPLALMSGTLSISTVEIGAAELDAAVFGTGAGFDLAAPRIDAFGRWQDDVYQGLDRIAARLSGAKANTFTLASLKITLPAKPGSGKPGSARPGSDRRIELRNARFKRSDASAMKLTGQIIRAGSSADVAFNVALSNGKVTSINADIRGLASAPFTLSMSKRHPGPYQGLDLTANLAIHSERGPDVRQHVLLAVVKAGKGQFWADSIAQNIDILEAAFEYDNAKQSLVLTNGALRLDGTTLPLQGAVIDLDRMGGVVEHGYAIDLLINDGVAASAVSSEQPLRFNAKASIVYRHANHELEATPISISTASGNIAGSLGLTFGKGSPEVSVSLRSTEISATAVKQLWPFWVAKGARKWVLENLYDGTMTNAGADVFIPAGAVQEGIPAVLDSDQLNVRFDIAGTRFNFLGDIPPARNASGHLEMNGGKLAVTLPSGEIFLPTGKSVKVTDASLSIDDVYVKPLMADIKLAASGEADAIAELSTFKPIEALQKTQYQTTDFSGAVTADVTARIGLIKAQNPPRADWRAQLELSGIDLAKPVAGRKITALDGTLDITPSGMTLESEADIDGAKFNLSVAQALNDPQGKQRKLSVKGSLGPDDIARFLPALKSIAGGTIKVKIDANTDGSQKIEADLTDAKLSVPWVGWRKGAGISAKASFTAKTEDGRTTVSDFTLKGDGFGAEGDIVVDRNGLASAKFGRLQLTPSDRYQIAMKRIENGLSIDVKGTTADIRPVLDSIKKEGGGREEKSKSQLRVTLTLARAVGYNKESLSDLKVKMVTDNGRISSLTLSGSTASGQAVVARKDNGEKLIEITSGDAGALARFADLYRNMRGGLLNIKLRAQNTEAWQGSIDIRNFALINEARLKSIVSTPAGNDGRSLNDAVKREIDVRSQKFQRAFARVLVNGGKVRIENGVVRGDQVGATFQGILRDAKGRMEMTGTFMPAYGINRLFGELPIIGAILGNGRDRGLLGITFKLAGPVESPKLSLNPLSLIAPGVFRNVFEFQ